MLSADPVLLAQIPAATARDADPEEVVVDFDGVVYLSSQPAEPGTEVRKSDGTVTDAISLHSTDNLYPRLFTQVGDYVYFAASTAVEGTTEGIELWRTDGTPSGTSLVADIVPEFDLSGLFWLTEFNGELIFGSDDGSTGLEPWRSDGTESGTVQIKDINPLGDSLQHDLIGINSYIEVSIGPFQEFQGQLFFSADDGIHGFELWKTDGTDSGTVLVKDINTGVDPSGSFPGYGYGSYGRFLESQGSLFFGAYTEGEGNELWKTDGTEEGTALVKNINPGNAGSYLEGLTYSGGNFFFRADDGTNGVELWKSDGTEAGTVLVKDITPGAGFSLPYRLTDVNGTLFFVYMDDQDGIDLWKSDGTEAGTVFVKEIAQRDRNPYGIDNEDLGLRMAVSGGTLFFTVEDETTGTELWKSDGTDAGTVLVADILPGSLSSNPTEITPIDGGVAFGIDGDGAEGGPRELWVSDGTSEGTYRASDLELPHYTHRSLTYIDSQLYFSADDGTVGQQPWVLDLALTPVADAGGPYNVGEGDAVLLSAANSRGQIYLYEWDLDNDGQYDDATGPTADFALADDGVFTVGLRVMGPGGTSSDTTTVTVSNVAPSAAIAGTTDIYRGETVTFTLLATDPSSLDQADLFTFEIDWDGDGGVDETLADVPSGTTVQHAFPALTATNIQVRATDKDGSTGVFSQAPITVSPHVLRAGDGGSIDLIWGGTSGVDVAFFLGKPSEAYIFVQFENQVLVNRLDRVNSTVTGKAIAHGYGSDDLLVGELLNAIPLEFYGGDGDDILVGGSLGDHLYGDDGDDLLLGGTGDTDGDDLLFGGLGRDTLFGHYGADTLNGGGGEDLLISDRFVFSDVPQAVQQIANEWKSARPISARVSNILGITSTGVNGGHILDPGVTIINDGEEDTLLGGLGLGNLDWFFYAFAQDLRGDANEIGEVETDSSP